MLKTNKILVFDFETTGLNPQFDQIIELGAQLYISKENQYILTKELNLLIKSPTPLSPKIIEITNITDEMLEQDGVDEEVAFYELTNLIDDETLLIAYNIAFDLGFLKALYQKYQNPRFEITNNILDVMAIYKDRHPFPHRLDNLVQKYQVEVKNTHRALDDVKATFEGLIKMNEELPNIEVYINKLGYNPKYNYSGPYMRHVKLIAQKGGMGEIVKNG